ncbi:ribonuclease H1-like [Belonocnema kinseyi]|uniref:ribonuclease H1-like n=1 Tax=Belonocnema kinseyi TaxID=2817044 RepID=UPI00143D47EE|nr:ribonuclease H1-like [Belonocnema kinseyi]
MTPPSESDESYRPAVKTVQDDGSDAPVFRSNCSAFPEVELKLSAHKIWFPSKGEPSSIRTGSKTKCLGQEVVDVYIDGACCHYGKGESKAAIGVWFGKDHPLNSSQKAVDRQTNNFAEIQTATLATIKAHEAGIKNLRFHIDLQFLIDSITKWILKWKENGWKTAERKPIINKTEFEKLKEAIGPLSVDWAHVSSHKGILGNEMADRLARAEAGQPETDLEAAQGPFQEGLDLNEKPSS